MPELGDFLKSIHYQKNNLMTSPDLDPIQVEKDYTKLIFVMNRCLSYFPDTIFHAQEMNMRSRLEGRLQYEYFLGAIGKRNRFAKGIKAENPEHLDIVKEYYSYSTKKARQALTILTEEDIEFIKARLYQGGVKRKKSSV